MTCHQSVEFGFIYMSPLLTIVLVILVVLSAVVSFLAWKFHSAWNDDIFDFKKSAEVYTEFEGGSSQGHGLHQPFEPGTKPMSVRFNTNVFRYQKKELIKQGSEFYQVFIDGYWKWQGQQRYAGVFYSAPLDGQEEPKEHKINTGHYFAFTAACALSEINHYLGNGSVQAYSTIEVEIELDDVLDLTDVNNIKVVADALHIEANLWDIVNELTGPSTGGSKFSGLFGHYARSRNYNGIIFFSARAMKEIHASTIRDSVFWDDVMEDITKEYIIQQMREDTDGICLVIFSGSLVTRAIRRYRYDNSRWEENYYYKYDENELDKLWGNFDKDYQDTQGRVAYILKDGSSQEKDS